MKSHMINTKTITKPAEHEPECRCGCAPCEETTCELTCLVQPRYYCGQMLTDADLTAMLRWAQDKFRLERFRGGWGVACGLDVRYDPANPSHVIISPGYALDCCGNDIVVCAPTSIDLTAECEAEECLDPWQQDDPKRAQAETEKDAGASDFDLGELFGRAGVFDLFLHYKEQPSDAQKALGRSVCSTRGECEWTRTREDFRVSVRPARDPDQQAWDRWENQYRTGRQKFIDFTSQPSPKGSVAADQVRGRLMEWLRQHPLERFGFVEEWIYGIEPGEFLNRRLEIARWLWFDYWTSLLGCACPSCDSADGVPLARVWITPSRSERRPSCFVLNVESAPPYRRVLQADPCWPAPAGCINLGQFAFQPIKAVEEALAQAGFHLRTYEVSEKELALPGLLRELTRCDTIFACPEDNVDEREEKTPAPEPMPEPVTPPREGGGPEVIGLNRERTSTRTGRAVLVVADLGEPWGRRVIGFCAPQVYL